MAREWRWQTTEVVNASTEAVARWFVDPKRLDDAVNLLERAGATDTAVVSWQENGKRIREIIYKTRAGTAVRQRMEDALDPDGNVLHRTADGWRTSREMVTKAGVTSENKQVRLLRLGHDFRPHRSGTLVTTEFVQEVTGGSWIERFLPPVAFRVTVNRQFRNLIKRCEADLPPS